MATLIEQDINKPHSISSTLKVLFLTLITRLDPFSRAFWVRGRQRQTNVFSLLWMNLVLVQWMNK